MNQLLFRVQAKTLPPQLSVLLVGPRNDGDTIDGNPLVGVSLSRLALSPVERRDRLAHVCDIVKRNFRVDG